MKRSLPVAILVVAATLLITASGALASSHEIFVFPVENGEYFATSSQSVILRYCWATISPGLVTRYLRKVDQSFELSDGSTVVQSLDDPALSPNWGPIEPHSLQPEFNCPGTGEGYVSWWVFDLGSLSAGDYVMRFERQLDHPVVDPCDVNSDGRPDRYYGGTAEIIIHVTD